MSKRSKYVVAAIASLSVTLLFLVQSQAKEEEGGRKLNESDLAFVMKAGEGGDAEVAMGKLAEEKADNTEVKAFARKMIEDHTKRNEKLIAIAKDKDVQLSHELKGEPKAAYDVLANLSGLDFDKHYIHHMIVAHQETITLFQNEADNGNDARLKEYATNSLKVFQEHLAMAKEIATKIGAEQ